MHIKFWYDNAIGNTFINNFIPQNKIFNYFYQKNPDNTQVESLIPDHIKSLKEITPSFNLSASIPYNEQQLAQGKNFVSYEPWYFEDWQNDSGAVSTTENKLCFENSFVKNWLDKYCDNTEILVWLPLEPYGVFKRPHFFDSIHNQFPRNKIRFVFNSLKTPNWTKDVDWLIYKPFDYWWYDVQRIYKDFKNLPELDTNKKATKFFSFYNYKYRLHRAVVYKDLLDSNLLDKADYTYNGLSFTVGEQYVRKYTDEHLRKISVSPKNIDFETFITSNQFVKFTADTLKRALWLSSGLEYDTTTTERFDMYKENFFYTNSYLDLITEGGIIDNTDNLCITEKTYRSIVHGNIFLIIGQPGTLEYLKSFGIETFDDIFDESYDSVLHWYERWKIIKQNLIKWVNLGLDKQQQYYIKSFDKLQHNRNIILDRDFSVDIKNLFED